MTSVLRRIEAPTRYGGLPLKGWLVVAAAFIVIVLIITVFKTPVAPTLVFLSWFVISPSVILGMWAHQQGVSVPTLVADFLRYAARRRRRLIVHTPVERLRGGVVLTGAVPQLDAPDPTAWNPAVDIDEVL